MAGLTVVGEEEVESPASSGLRVVGEEPATPPPTGLNQRRSSPAAPTSAWEFSRRNLPQPPQLEEGKPWYVPSSMDVMPTSYTPGSGPTFAPTPGSGEKGEAVTEATQAAKRAGEETGSGILGYPKIVEGVKRVAATGVVRPGSSYYIPPQVTPTPEQSKELASGAAEAISGAGEAATPLIAEAAGARPITTGLGFLAGYGASKGAGAIVHGNTTPENEELIRQLAFWAPGLAGTLAGFHGTGIETPEVSTREVTGFGGRVGAGVARTPEGTTFRGKVGPFKGGFTVPSGTQPSAAGTVLESPTIEGAIQPPTTPGEQALADSQVIQQRAANVVSGKPAFTPPPPPPGPPTPPDVAQGHITPETVQMIGGLLAKLPPEQRAQGMIETHGTLSKLLLQQGKMVGPDGKIYVIDSPKTADKLATDLMNQEVELQDKASKATRSAEEKRPAAANASPVAAAGEPEKRVTRKQRAAELSQTPLRVVGVESAGEANDVDTAKSGERISGVDENATLSNADSNDNARVASAHGLDSVGTQSSGEIIGGPSNSPLSVIGEEEAGVKPSASENKNAAGEVLQPTIQTPAERNGQTVQPAGGVLQKRETSEVGLQTGESAATRAFVKGDQVLLPKGEIGTIKTFFGGHVNPSARIEVKSDDGTTRKATVQISKLRHPEASSQGNLAPVESSAETPAMERGAFHGEGVSTELKAPESKPYKEPLPENIGFDHSIQTGPDIGQKSRAEMPALPRGERRKIPRTPEEIETQELWKQARAELGDTKEHLADLTTEQVEKRVEELRADRRKTGGPKPGEVGTMKLSDLKLSPNKFQYKLGTDAEGVSTLLKDVKIFNPELADNISVWRDPADGKTYVVNGHHRYELAKRTGVKSITVRHLVAKDAAHARAIGARQNIAQGRGTPFDAAKFFRDTSITPEDLEKEGISLGEATAHDGLALSKLDPSLFNKVVSGDLRQGRAVAIGEATADHAEQKAILGLVEKRERGGGKVNDETLRELIRLVKGSEQTTETTADLFGSQEIRRSLALEKAEISAHIKSQLAKDKKLFGFVAKGDRATELARAGNKINVEESKAVSQGAAQAEEVYNKLSERGGPISTILDESARRLADGENAGTIKSEAYQRVRKEISNTLGTGENQVSQGLEKGTGRSETTEAKAGEPEGSVDLFSPKNPPLFNSPAGSILPSDAAKVSFEVHTPPGRIPSYLTLNPQAMTLMRRAMGKNFLGVNIGPENVPRVIRKLNEEVEQLDDNGHSDASTKIQQLISALLKNTDDHSGLSIIASTESPVEISVIHEELYHAAVQRRPGKGEHLTGIPWKEMRGDHGIAKLAERIGGDMHASIVVAEAMADLVTGSYAEGEISPQLAYKTAHNYYTAVADKHGLEPLEAASELYDYIDSLAVERGIIRPEERFNEPATTPARNALAEVLTTRRTAGSTQGSSGLQPEPKRSDEGSLERSGESVSGIRPTSGAVEGVRPKPQIHAWTAARRDAMARSSEWGQPVRLGESDGRQAIEAGSGSLPETPGRGKSENTSTGSLLTPESTSRSIKRDSASDKATDLHAAATPGLTDEELENWKQSKGFRYEDAGDQMGMFGDHDKLLRVYRTGPKGKEQSGLIYQNQLDRLDQKSNEPSEPFALTGGEAAPEEQPRLFGAGDLGEIIGNTQPGRKNFPNDDESTSLFRGESGTLEPGKIREFLDEKLKDLRGAREVERGIFDLEARHSGRVLKAAQMIQQANEKYGKQAIPDYAQIYHHLENPEGESLTSQQDEILDNVVLPVMEANDELAQELKEGLVPIENYVHRVVKGKGGWFDRILAGSKGTGKGNILSKSAPQTKGRTMMALERNDGLYKDRMIISIKGGQVTAWKDGHPENLGGISHTDEGKVWRDKDGGEWTLTQATTKEIEKNTELEYYHNALASALTSNLQLAKAVDALHFINALKASPEFKDIAFEDGKGNPPSGWKPTSLPQLRGYSFEPHYADVFDRYAERLRTSPGAFDQIGAFMRVAMLLNPLMHPMNVAGSWVVDRAPDIFMPWTWKRNFKAGMQAIKDVATQNQNFLDDLDEGAALQSHREATRNITKLFFDQLGDGLTQEKPWALEVAKSLGMAPATLLQGLHKLSSKVAWIASDIMYLQSAYANKAAGLSLKESLRETGRNIAEYRLPTHVLNSKGVGKLMGNSWLTIFGSYHHALLRSFAENGKSALGLNEKPAGGNRVKDVTDAWLRLAMTGMVAMLLYPLLDDVYKKLTGDEKARAKRFGPFAVIDAWDQVRRKTKSPGDALMTSVTPAPQTKAAVEMVANRQFFNGRQIYNPHDDWETQAQQIGSYLFDQLGMLGQGKRASESASERKKFLWGQIGVQFRGSDAERIAQDISNHKMGSEAAEPGEMQDYGNRRDILDALRAGNSKLLDNAREKHELTHRQILNLEHRAKMTPLQDKVNGFTYPEFMRVYNAATEKEKDELQHIYRRKLSNRMQDIRSRGQQAVNQ